jgi:hypothetical protein
VRHVQARAEPRDRAGHRDRNRQVDPARRWLDGFEHGGLAEGTAGQQYVARAAPRHLQGYGWKNDRHTEVFMHQDDERALRRRVVSTRAMGTGLYIRIHRYPTGEGAHLADVSAAGMRSSVTSSP